MVSLKPALETRGFEVAVFHATGMGGRAFELLAAQGYAAFCEQTRQQCPDNVVLTEVDALINDAEFAEQALAVFDQWCVKVSSTKS